MGQSLHGEVHVVIESFKRCRRAAGLGCTAALAGAIVSLAGLVLVPAAAADGWTVQPLATQSSWVRSDLSGVSCVATNDCYAVGFSEQSNGGASALIEKWNGSSWFIWNSGGPAGSSNSVLNGVSCPYGGTFCMAVGEYDNGGRAQPLVYTWGGSGGFVRQTAPVGPGALAGDSLYSWRRAGSASLSAAWTWALPLRVWGALS
jgi:hypothetical protein